MDIIQGIEKVQFAQPWKVPILNFIFIPFLSVIADLRRHKTPPPTLASVL